MVPYHSHFVPVKYHTEMNADLTDELTNSVVPTSVSGLVAEEWTIHPLSPMPSFLERVFMEEAQNSTYRGLETVHQLLLDYMERSILALARLRNERAATTSSHTTPSRFQVVQSQLWHGSQELARQILRRLIVVMRTYKYAIVAWFIYTIERSSLERASCLLSESFYGGRRVKLSPTNKAGERKTAPLTTKEKVRLAGMLALSFYVKRKFDALYHRWKARAPVLSDKQSLFVGLYPWVRTVLQSASFLYKWNYLLGVSPFYDWPSALLDQWVRRVARDESETKSTPSSAEEEAAVDEPKDHDQESRLVQNIWAGISLTMLLSWITWGRSVWLQICQDQDKEQTLPPPPPPLTLTKVATGSCCLCGTRPPRQPTACTVSGYVGCGACMEKYLQRHGRCPVTQISCAADSWVRLYEPRS